MARYIIGYVSMCVYVHFPFLQPNPPRNLWIKLFSCKLQSFCFSCFRFRFVLFLNSHFIFASARPFKLFLIGIVKLMIAVVVRLVFLDFPPILVYKKLMCEKYNIDNKFSVFVCFRGTWNVFSHFQIRFYYSLSPLTTTHLTGASQDHLQIFMKGKET